MLVSMTGYGKAEEDFGDFTLVVEVKSLNSRFLEIIPKLPQGLFQLEYDLKKYVKEILNRGRVELSVRLVYSSKQPQIFIDEEKVGNLVGLIEKLKGHFNISGELSFTDLVALESRFGPIFSVPESTPLENVITKEVLFSVISKGVNELVNMRKVEGRLLQVDVISKLNTINGLVTEIEETVKNLPLIYQERLKARLQTLLEDSSVVVSDDRVAQEIAIIVDKCDISEELTRLHSHISQFFDIIDNADTAGKQLEFLLQEMNREINTIGSKGNSSNISKCVILLKAEVEKIREMLQNIE